jgi:hypothetical protein
VVIRIIISETWSRLSWETEKPVWFHHHEYLFYIRDDPDHNIGNLIPTESGDRETCMVPSSRISLHIREDWNQWHRKPDPDWVGRQRSLLGSIFTDISFEFVKTGSWYRKPDPD